MIVICETKRKAEFLAFEVFPSCCLVLTFNPEPTDRVLFPSSSSSSSASSSASFPSSSPSHCYRRHCVVPYKVTIIIILPLFFLQCLLLFHHGRSVDDARFIPSIGWRTWNNRASKLGGKSKGTLSRFCVVQESSWRGESSLFRSTTGPRGEREKGRGYYLHCREHAK